MPPRYSWKSTLRLSLVSVPVVAYNAAESRDDEVGLNQLHDKCHSRIRYQKVCPIHGEVSKDEIVMGYEYTKDQYVVIDPDELDAMRTKDEKAIHVETFIRPGAIDPIYFDGRTYYLLPDGPAAQKHYAVLRESMLAEQKHAVGQAVFSGRDHLALVRPAGKLLLLQTLHYTAEIKEAAAFEEEVAAPAVSKQELKLAETLITASTAKSFRLDRFKDTYTEKLRALIEAKVEGREIVAPPEEKEPEVINLMDALRESVERVKRDEPTKRPRKAVAQRRTKAAGRKRRSSA